LRVFLILAIQVFTIFAYKIESQALSVLSILIVSVIGYVLLYLYEKMLLKPNLDDYKFELECAFIEDAANKCKEIK